MPLFVGQGAAAKVYIGATPATGVYLGASKVWPGAALTGWTTPDPINGATGCGPGYPVTITGSGLAGAAVAFGGVPATVVSNDGATIVATVPATGYGYESPAGRATPITATVNGVPVDGSLPFTTFERYNGYAYNSDTDIVLALESTAWQNVATFPLLGCKPATYLKLSFEFGNSAIQWIPFDTAIRILIPRTGATVQDTERRTVAGWPGSISLLLDQHAGDVCQIDAYSASSYDSANTLKFVRVMQQDTASDAPIVEQQ